MPNTSIHLSRCNILQNNKLQPAEIYKESQQTAKLEFFCDESLKISQSRYGLSTSTDSIANLLAFFTKASDAIDSIKTQKIDVHSYGFVPIRHFVEHVITYKNEFAADYEPYTLTFTRGENNEGILSVESKEGFISQRTINLNEYETAINIINEHVIKENIHNTVQSPTEKDISKINSSDKPYKTSSKESIKSQLYSDQKNIQTCYYILIKNTEWYKYASSEERYDKFKNSSKEIKNTYKQIVQAQKKLNQMKYINKLSGELIDITDKKLAPLINDSFSYTRDFFAYSKQEKNIFTFDNSKFVDPKEKEGLMVQHSNGQLVITGKYCPEGVQTAFTQEQYDKLIRYINIFFTFPKLE
ncbi:hypothetical protein GW236_00440 [Escherichia coli]|nr:hypothetical protein [Escherichia coli]EFJ2135883.1 hypothetical protein [Escherichia coli]